MILDKVIETINKHNMISSDDHIVVGVSGGGDSVALLQVLNALKERWRLKLTVAHLDHMIRAEASREEAKFVKDLAKEMDIQCVSEERDVLSHKTAKGLSLQEAAREVRYKFFLDVFKGVHADKIALGHNADDQAETVLMWFIRGAALKGLSGIPPLREGIFIRPLIEIARKDIEKYLNNRRIKYVPDVSVFERHYLRNKIRHNLLPLLQQEYNPRIVKTITRTADLLRLDNEILEKEVQDAVNKVLVREDDKFCCSIDMLKQYPLSLHGRIIRRIICDLKGHTKGLSFKNIEAVCGLLYKKGPSKLVQLPGRWSVWREYGNLVFTGKEAAKGSYRYSFKGLPESVKVDKTGRQIFFRVEKFEGKNSILQGKDKNVEFLNYEKIKFPLVVRSLLPGDRFYPLGLGGSKKLKDFFIDSKVSVRERYNVPVIVSRDRIACVCGFRIDERFKLQPDTKEVLKVWFE